MEGALDTLLDHLTHAESHTSVRAFIDHHREVAFVIAPGDHLFAHPGDAYGLSQLYFIGFQNGVPLVRDHASSAWPVDQPAIIQVVLSHNGWNFAVKCRNSSGAYVNLYPRMLDFRFAIRANVSAT